MFYTRLAKEGNIIAGYRIFEGHTIAWYQIDKHVLKDCWVPDLEGYMIDELMSARLIKQGYMIAGDSEVSFLFKSSWHFIINEHYVYMMKLGNNYIKTVFVLNRNLSK